MKKSETKNTGKTGEDYALDYLKKLGYFLISRNYHTRYGEIDLIMQKEKNIYFYEVKYRKTVKYGFGEESISRSKIEKLRKSIEIWVTQNQSKVDFENIFLTAVIIDGSGINLFEIF
jgi:putative endonuclease